MPERNDNSVNPRKILCLCGSLRQQSINRALLISLQRHANEVSAHKSDFQFEQFDAIAELPLFNPDLEGQLPVAVQTLHAAIVWSDLIVIASPEYAHGVTGVIKNALDWCVSLEAFVHKPVLVLQARARSQFADAALHETLKTMSARILNQASLVFDLKQASFSTEGMLAAPEVRRQLQSALEILAGA